MLLWSHVKQDIIFLNCHSSNIIRQLRIIGGDTHKQTDAYGVLVSLFLTFFFHHFHHHIAVKNRTTITFEHGQASFIKYLVQTSIFISIFSSNLHSWVSMVKNTMAYKTNMCVSLLLDLIENDSFIWACVWCLFTEEEINAARPCAWTAESLQSHRCYIKK